MPEFADVTPPDGTARQQTLTAGGAGSRVQDPQHPYGLGTLGTAAAWLAGCQGAAPPRVPSDVRVVVVTAGHGVAARDVSARQKAAVPVEAAAGDAKIETVDAGRSGAIDVEDALTDDALDTAVELGRQTADAAVDDGADLIVTANSAVASTTVAAALVAVMTATEPVQVVGRGSGVDDAGWMRKAKAVRDAYRRAKLHVADPLLLMRTAGGADVAALTGLLAQAAARRTPVILGGATVMAAALIAEELAPGAKAWWHAGCRSTEPAYELAREHLDLTPMLPVDLDGDGELAGVLALSALMTAVRVANQPS